ncbi:MAG: CDP-alcohol phosphatidyltransferase family protein [Chloroflexi bacterium]|uniref:CDP-alcohol phosphatidyltransferase family protein n=1 Tax=Candidatus Flexifilum breve TaxID=3140694 RepID=UPI003135CEA9|nr:CDP-alcohol phosphatidyltransferase family protein [Chloroflexota bacterium]
MAVHRMGVHPDVITIIGLVVVAIGGYFIAVGQLQIGGVLLVISLPLDALDGAVARAMQRTDRRGAVLDSTLDRYADGLIFGGLAYYFAVQDQYGYFLLSLASLVGSFVVSYVRARAGEADLSVKIGLFSRFERVVALLLMLLVPPLLIPMLWVLAVGTNITGVQRLLYVYRHLDKN